MRLCTSTAASTRNPWRWCPVTTQSTYSRPLARGCARVFAWLERLVAETRAEGMEVETEVEWNDNWRQAIVAAAARQSADIVVKNMTQHSRFVRLVRETSDWTLIRERHCPVLLVKTGRPYKVENILMVFPPNKFGW